MKQNDIKIQPVRNKVAEIYTKATGSNIIGELMMAAGASTRELNFTVISPVFLCSASKIYFYIICSHAVTEENNINGNYTHGGVTVDIHLANALEINEETLPQIEDAFPDFDFSGYIGQYILGMLSGNEDNIVEGDEYTFTVNGNDAGTYTAACQE